MRNWAERLMEWVEAVRRARRAAREHLKWAAIYVWRALMFRTTVIAITGSVGKTTAKECLAAILGTRAPTHRTRNNENDEIGVPRSVSRIRPWHRFAVIEIGTQGPGDMARAARLVRPDVAIVLSVARTHTNAFRTLDDTAAEKAELLKYVRRSGTVLLNGDDPRVRAMALHCRTRVRLFGQSPGCDVRAEHVSSVWPQRFSFDVLAGDVRVPVQSRLVGTHWLSSVLAALTAALHCGVALPHAARAVAQVAPFAGRMQPVTLPNGATVVRDEENGSPDTLIAMLKVMREARATRRILAIGDVSDTNANQRKRQRELGAIAAEIADVALFMSGRSHDAARAAIAAGMDPAACHTAVGLEQAAALLSTKLRAGDLVFLKGRTTEHVTRVLFAQFGRIGCWKHSCRVRRVCDICPELRPKFDLDATLARAAERSLPSAITSAPVEQRRDAWVEQSRVEPVAVIGFSKS